MDQLKKLLRLAIQDQAASLILQDGQFAAMQTSAGAKVLDGDARITADDLHKLFDFLFPHDKAQLTARQVTKGALNVPNVGKILLIAQPAAPQCLRLYFPPHGQSLFDNDWAMLTSKSVVPAVPNVVPQAVRSMAPPPPAPPAAPAPLSMPVAAIAPSAPAPVSAPAPIPAAGGFVPLQFLGGQGDLPPMPEPARASSAPAVPPISAPKTPPAADPQAMFAIPPLVVPAAVVPAAVVPGVGVFAPVAPPAVQPAESISAFEPIAPLEALGAVESVESIDVMQPFEPINVAPSIPKVMAPPAAPAPASRPLRPLSPAPGLTAPPVANEPAAEEALPEISFSAEAPGSTAVSDGRNPIDPILIEMVKRRASDLHITTSEPYCYRVDGEIQRISESPVTPEEMQRYLMPIIPRRNHAEFVKGNDTDFAYEITGVGRFRVNIFRDRNGVGTVMRHIPSKILTAEQLNLPPAITKFCQLTKGLVVVTGPTGSGKSTTLAAMLDLINKTRHDHILTIEDPIEFVHPQQRCLVNQREVHKHTSSFSRALRAALREDPDIVLIGEMRDLETIAIAIETAETGHLVFGTLHTTTAVSTIDRIVDQFPTTQQEQIRMMLSSSLRGVVAQTLLKKKGGGRVAAHEILVTVDAVSAMIREGKNHMIPNHMQSQRGDGNVLLNDSLVKLVKENVVDADDAMKKAVDKVALGEMFKRNGIQFAGAPAPAAPGAPAKPTKQSA